MKQIFAMFSGLTGIYSVLFSIGSRFLGKASTVFLIGSTIFEVFKEKYETNTLNPETKALFQETASAFFHFLFCCKKLGTHVKNQVEIEESLEDVRNKLSQAKEIFESFSISDDEKACLEAYSAKMSDLVGIQGQLMQMESYRQFHLYGKNLVSHSELMDFVAKGLVDEETYMEIMGKVFTSGIAKFEIKNMDQPFYLVNEVYILERGEGE